MTTNVVYLSGPSQPIWKPLAVAGASTIIMVGVLGGAGSLGVDLGNWISGSLLLVYLYVNGLAGYKYVKQSPPGSVETPLSPPQLADAMATWPHVLDTGLDARQIPTAITYYQRGVAQQVKAKRDAAAAKAAQDAAYILTPEQEVASRRAAPVTDALQAAVDDLIPNPAPAAAAPASPAMVRRDA